MVSVAQRSLAAAGTRLCTVAQLLTPALSATKGRYKQEQVFPGLPAARAAQNHPPAEAALPAAAAGKNWNSPPDAAVLLTQHRQGASQQKVWQLVSSKPGMPAHDRCPCAPSKPEGTSQHQEGRLQPLSGTQTSAAGLTSASSRMSRALSPTTARCSSTDAPRADHKGG